MAAFAPLFGKSLGVKKAPITFTIDGKVRKAAIPDVLPMSVEPLPTLAEGGEIWAETGHPVNPKKLALATGRSRGDFPCRSDEHLVAPSDCLHLRGKRASRRAARNTT